MWDSQLPWKEHVPMLKAKCLKSLNLLRAVSSESWGADRCTLMRLYRSIIRPKLDYGALVYCSASDSLLNSLDVIPNEAMRISTGAFKSMSITSLNMLTNEPSLVLRKSELTLRYYFKMKCYLLNPAYECVLNDTLHRQLWQYCGLSIHCERRRGNPSIQSSNTTCIAFQDDANTQMLN